MAVKASRSEPEGSLDGHASIRILGEEEWQTVRSCGSLAPGVGVGSVGVRHCCPASIRTLVKQVASASVLAGVLKTMGAAISEAFCRSAAEPARRSSPSTQSPELGVWGTLTIEQSLRRLAELLFGLIQGVVDFAGSE